MNNPLSSENPLTIGYIVGGGLKENLRARLTVPPSDIREGSFVIIEDGRFVYNGLVTDLQLGATDPRFADEQSGERLPGGLAELLHGQTLFTNIVILPQLMAERPPAPDDPLYAAYAKAHEDDGEDKFSAIKTIPAHHALVRLADQGDINDVFGDPTKKESFSIGTVGEEAHKVCLNLPKLVQRSSGIFGATGTGKSFLTRIILAGLVKSNVAGALIFDMHNEYGPSVRDTDRNVVIPGLKAKFNEQVRLVGLGSGTMVGDMNVDLSLNLQERDIKTIDIEMMTRELNLKETTPATLHALDSSFGANWFHEFKAMRLGLTEENEDGRQVPAPGSVAFWAREAGVNELAAEGLYRKLITVFDRPYIQPNPPGNPVGQIVNWLKGGKHVVLAFGDYTSDLDYLLTANVLTRSIRENWKEQTEGYLRNEQGAVQPRPLVIVIEEAHKLLNREMAGQTAFREIAREMRKYHVTLLIVDQRPSQIDDEVMSQLGTRVSGWLGDELDIGAVLSGLASKDSLRGMLARLQPKQEILLLGWGMPMPIPVRSRRYDENFWTELLGKPDVAAQTAARNRVLFGAEED